jgi:hypothetical protein
MHEGIFEQQRHTPQPGKLFAQHIQGVGTLYVTTWKNCSSDHDSGLENATMRNSGVDAQRRRMSRSL